MIGKKIKSLLVQEEIVNLFYGIFYALCNPFFVIYFCSLILYRPAFFSPSSILLVELS